MLCAHQEAACGASASGWKREHDPANGKQILLRRFKDGRILAEH